MGLAQGAELSSMGNKTAVFHFEHRSLSFWLPYRF